MNPNDEKLTLPDILRREMVYRGRRINLERLTVRPPDGRETVREIVRHPGAVVLLPITEAGRVVFERNVRVGIGQTLLELPAGTLEPGENPADCAARELTEETGYVAGRVEPLLDFYTSPGVMDERIWAFVATGLRGSPGPTHLDAGEQIVIELVEYADALAMCSDGRLRDAKSIVTLLTHGAKGGIG